MLHPTPRQPGQAEGGVDDADAFCIVCKQERDGIYMLHCDMCDRAFHLKCAGVDVEKANTAPSWYCGHCRPIHERRVKDEVLVQSRRRRVASSRRMASGLEGEPTVRAAVQPTPLWGESGPEAMVGLRIEVDASLLNDYEAVGLANSVSPRLEFDRGLALAMVEGYSPSRRMHFVVFDDPNPSYDMDYQPLYGLTVVVNDGSYITYERDASACGSCTLRKGVAAKGSLWFAAWVDLNQGLLMGKIRVVEDEALFCLCRRPVAGEPPPPMQDTGVEEIKEDSDWLECSACGEWYHDDCLVSVDQDVRQGTVDIGVWKCPLCSDKIKVIGPPPYRGPLVIPARSAVWRAHAERQRAFNNAGVEWQWWQHHATYRVDGPGLQGEWVLAMTNFRRFINASAATVKSLNEPPQVEGRDIGWEGSSIWPMRLLLTDAIGSSIMEDPLVVIKSAIKPRRAINLDQPIPRPTGIKLSRLLPVTYHRDVLLRNLFIKQKELRKSAGEKQKDNLAANSSNPREQRNQARKLGEAELQLSCMRGRRLRLGKSPIHGWGVFTEELIRKDDWVIEYVGEVIPPAVAEVRLRHYREQGEPNFMFSMDLNHVCDATMKGNLARFMNHSCEPNCKSQKVPHNGSVRIYIYALRNIMPGEELTYDYEILRDEEAKVDCKCYAANCRGFLN